MSIECHIEMCSILYKNIAIVCIYRPPNGNYDLFFEAVSNALQVAIKKYQYVILCGDLNIDFSKDTLTKNRLLDIFQSYQLNITTHEPTRIFTNCNGQTSCTTIDYLTTNLPEHTYCCKIINPFIADHLAQIIDAKVAQNPRMKETNYEMITYRDMTEENILKFVQNIQNVDWTRIYIENVNLAFEILVYNLNWHLNICCPTIKKTVHYKRPENKWYTKELTLERQKLKNHYWLAVNSNSEVLKNTYKIKNKQYKKNIRTIKSNYYTKKIQMASNKSRETWKIVNETLGKNKKTNKQITITFNNMIVKDPNTIANAFADHFSSAALTSLRQHKGENLTLPCTTMDSVANSLFIPYVDENDVKRELGNLKNKKSTGLDEISIKILKSIGEEICKLLTYLINKSLALGTFPDILKTACVIPVFKKDDPLNIGNYRQISLLSALSKLIERIVYNIIIKYLNRTQIISTSQHGFRENMSVETASYQLLNFVYKELDEGKYVLSLMFDLSRAFDTVDAEFLRQKLYAVGIRGSMLQWISSYISSRKMVVKHANVKSETKDIQMGVPQGSVLGPLLFMIYVNDLPSYISKGQVTMFADDTTITIAAPTPEELSSNLICVRDELEAWCQRNNLILNNSKTVSLNFHVRKPLPTNFETLHNIELSDTAKFLGTHLDSKLSWNKHIDFVCSKLNSAYFAILQMKSHINVEGLLSIYYGLAYSHVANNIVSWGIANNIQRVLIGQKRIIRLIFNKGRMESCRNVYIQNNILTVPSILLWKCALYVFKHKSNFKSVGGYHSYSTRHGNNLSTSLHKTSLFENSPDYNFIKIFNKLPVQLREMKGYYKFKKQTKHFFIEKAFYSTQEYFDT